MRLLKSIVSGPLHVDDTLLKQKSITEANYTKINALKLYH